MFNKIVTNVTRIRSLFSNGNGRTTAAFAFGRSVILTSVVVTGVLVGLRQMGTMQGLELGAYDQLMRSLPDRGPDNRLLVVGVTEEDIQTRKEYPIKDETLAQLLEKLEQYQPRTIGVDILRDVPQGSPQGRIALEEILKQNDNIIAGCKLSSADQPGIAAAPGVTEERVGFADLPLDPGGTLRRSLLLSIPTAPKTPPRIQHICNIPDPNNQLPSFSFQLALLYLEAQNIQPEQTQTGEIKLGSTVLKRLEGQSGGYHQADAADYRLMLRYRSPKNAVKQVSLTEVLDGKIDPALVKDRIVLIGYTAPIVKDDFYTPYSAGLQDNQKMPGVVIQAQNVSQILSAVLDNRPLIWYWSEGSEILWIWGWSLVGAIWAWRVRRLWLFGIGVVAAVGVLYGTCYIIFSSSGWVPLVPPALALVLTAGTVVLVDRGFAKAIYQGVKKVILNIEIDEDKKQQQVAAITESESFAELEKKAEELRQRRRRDRRSENAVESETEAEEATQARVGSQPVGNGEDKGDKGDKEDKEESSFQPTTDDHTPQVPQEAEPTEEDDYFQQLQKRGKQLRNKANETTPTPQDSQPTEDAQEEDYFEQLQKRGKKLRNTEDESEP